MDTTMWEPTPRLRWVKRIPKDHTTYDTNTGNPKWYCRVLQQAWKERDTDWPLVEWRDVPEVEEEVEEGVPLQ